MPTTGDDTPPELRTIVVTQVGGDWRARALEAEDENRAVHAELAKARELIDALTVMASDSWQKADAAKARLRQLEAPPVKPPLGRRPTIKNRGVVFRLLTKKIREYREPTRHDLVYVMQGVAAELGVTPKRVEQIVRGAMKERGLVFRK